MIAIVIYIAVSLSILLSAFVSFSPSFKSLIEGDFKRKAKESAWAYALKSGQLIARANSLNNPPDHWACTGNTAVWNCKEALPLRNEIAGGVDTDIEHICTEISGNTTHITVNSVDSSRQTCP